MRLTVLHGPAYPRWTVPRARAEAMESKSKSKEPGNARLFAFQAQSLWWTCYRARRNLSGGGGAP
jgi:hypothetical protein